MKIWYYSERNKDVAIKVGVTVFGLALPWLWFGVLDWSGESLVMLLAWALVAFIIYAVTSKSR